MDASLFISRYLSSSRIVTPNAHWFMKISIGKHLWTYTAAFLPNIILYMQKGMYPSSGALIFLLKLLLGTVVRLDVSYSS